MTGQTTEQLRRCIQIARHGDTVHFVWASGLRHIRKQLMFLCRQMSVDALRMDDEDAVLVGRGRIHFHHHTKAPKRRYMPNASHWLIADHKAQQLPVRAWEA